MKNKTNKGSRRNLHDEIEAVFSTLSGIGKSFRDMQTDLLKTIGTQMNRLVEFEKNINIIAGGALPKTIIPDIEAVKAIVNDADEMTDEEFLERLAEVASASDAVQRISTLTSLFVQIQRQINSCDARIEKLAKRIRTDSGAEKTVAKTLKSRLHSAKRVWEARQTRVLASFFETREYLLNAAVQAGSAILKSYPDGSTALRDAYVAYGTETVTDVIASQNIAFNLGKRKISSASGKGGVQI